MSTFQICFIFFLVSIVLCSILTLIAFIRSKQNSYFEKNTAYECGLDPFFTPYSSYFNIHYYGIAILFIILDIEIILIFPWISYIHELGIEVYKTILFFFFTIGVGLIYEFKKGILDIKKN